MCLTRPSIHSRHSSRSRHSRDIPGIPVIHDLPAFPGNSTNSTMFQYLQGIHPISAFSDQNAYSTVRLVSTENSTEYQLGNYRHYKHSFFKEREMLRYRSNWQILHNRIISFFVLSSDNTNCKCCDIGQIDRLFKIELFPLSSCQMIILIARMTFNCFPSCLMS